MPWLVVVMLIVCVSVSGRGAAIPADPGAVMAGPGQVIRRPTSPRAVPGRPYEISIHTHCGVGSVAIDFDGAFWIPDPPVPEHVDGLGQPVDSGMISLVDPSRATYVSRLGARIALARVDGPRTFTLCR